LNRRCISTCTRRRWHDCTRFCCHSRKGR